MEYEDEDGGDLYEEAFSACEGSAVKDRCGEGLDIAKGKGDGFCVGWKASKLWCYFPSDEKRPAQKACVGKEADDACEYNPDGHNRKGVCAKREGEFQWSGMLRCFPNKGEKASQKCSSSGGPDPSADP